MPPWHDYVKHRIKTLQSSGPPGQNLGNSETSPPQKVKGMDVKRFFRTLNSIVALPPGLVYSIVLRAITINQFSSDKN